MRTKKTPLLFRAQKHVIDLADRFQSRLEQLVVLQLLLDSGFQFRANAELFGDAAGITDSEHANRVTTATSALGATFFMPDVALE